MAPVRVASFGKVSVVMIAWAAAGQASGRLGLRTSASTPSNLRASSGSPMTPVEARKISSAGIPPPGGDVGRQRTASRPAGP